MREFTGVNILHYEGFSIRLMAYEMALLAGEMKLTEHDAVQRVALEETARDYDLAPAEVSLLQLIMTKTGRHW